MKQFVFFIVFATLCILPFSAWGQDKKNYLMLKGGLFEFTDNMKEATFDTGFNGEIVAGHYLHPNISVELGTGYFHDGVNKGFGNSIKGFPVMLTAKGLYPVKGLEFFAGGGIGLYHMRFHGRVNGMVTDTNDTVMGAHVLAGANIDISRSFFAGVEGKYIFTDKADFNLFQSRLNGRVATINFGCRF